MGESVVWIDDKVKVMEEVVSNIFPSLWEKDITSYIGIINEPEINVKDLNRIVFQEFTKYLSEKEYINNDEKVVKKKKLVKTATKTPKDKEKTPFADVVLDISDLFKKYRSDINKFYEEYKTSEIEEDISDKENKEEDNNISSPTVDDGNAKNNHAFFEEFNNNIMKKFIAEIMERFSEDSWYGIDLCLIDGDYDILKKKIDSPILSMALYHALTKQTEKIFMYTTFFVPKNIIEEWKSLYNKHFENNGNEIKFFKRQGDNALEGGKPDKIINLFEEAQK